MSNGSSPPERFKPTRWSLVLQARGEGEAARRALEDLCRVYWPPLYAWCRRHGLSPADAEDAVQGFFARLLEKKMFEAADASKGKLRTFLLTALQRHVKDERVKSLAERRGGGRGVSFDAVHAEEWYTTSTIEGESADHMYDRQWALAVLEQALQALEQRAIERNKRTEHEAMRRFLTREGRASEYEEAGKLLGLSANAFKVGVHRLRTRYGDALRAVVAETQPDDADIDTEMAYLLRALRAP